MGEHFKEGVGTLNSSHLTPPLNFFPKLGSRNPRPTNGNAATYHYITHVVVVVVVFVLFATCLHPFVFIGTLFIRAQLIRTSGLEMANIKEHHCYLPRRKMGGKSRRCTGLCCLPGRCSATHKVENVIVF